MLRQRWLLSSHVAIKGDHSASGSDSAEDSPIINLVSHLDKVDVGPERKITLVGGGSL